MNQITPITKEYIFNKKFKELNVQKCNCCKFVPIKPIYCQCGLKIDDHDFKLIEKFFYSNLDLITNLKKRKLRSNQDQETKPACSEFLIENVDSLKCKCNRKFREHSMDVVFRFIKEDYKNTESTWTYDTCTTDDGETDAYGDVLFLGFDRTSKYVKVSHRTEMEPMLELLFSKYLWNLEPPKLLISITGGTKLYMKPNLKDCFCKGLLKVAQTTDAWVISGGINLGCMKLVGEVFKDSEFLLSNENKKTIVLGISNWATIRGNQSLVVSSDANKKKNKAAEYEMMLPKRSQDDKSAHLDPNHSHFILVDSGCLDQFGGEIKFRSKLESAIAKQKIKNKLDSDIKLDINVPTVVLVLGGGRNTIVQVLSSVENGIPCIIFDDTGKFSNVFCYILKNIEKREKIFKDFKNADGIYEFDDWFYEEIKINIVNEMKENNVMTHIEVDEERIEPIMKNLERIFQLKNLHLLSYFKLKPNDVSYGVDVAILNGLFKSLNSNVKHSSVKDHQQEIINYKSQLNLCLVWNRFDMAKQFTLFNELDKIDCLDEFMYFSIKNDRHEFVELFLESGFVLKHFLTHRRLLKLYHDIPKNCEFYKLLVKQDKWDKLNLDHEDRVIVFGENLKYHGDAFTFKTIGSVIQTLVDKFFRHKFTQLPFSKINKDQIGTILLETDSIGKAKRKTIGIMNTHDKKTEINIDNRCENPEHELFIYSVLMNRPKLAEVFWNSTKNSMCSALVATKISKKYAQKFESRQLLFNNTAKYFESLACELLELCHKSNDEKTEKLLLIKVPEYGFSTTMQIAILANSLDFISHPSCQTLLTKLWFNRISLENPRLRIYFCAFVPFLAPILIDFGSQKQKKHVSKFTLSERDSEDFDPNDDDDIRAVISGSSTDGKSPTNESVGGYSRKSSFKHMLPYVYAKRFYYFMKSPLVKFFYHQVFYLMFLTLFSYILLCDFYQVNQNPHQSSTLGLSISIPEIVLIIWITTFALEEIRQLLMIETKIFIGKFSTYINQNWNFIGIFAFSFYYTSLALRFIADAKCFQAARIILSIDIIFWFIKYLEAYWFLKKVGPILVLIEKMTKTLFYFFLIILVFMFAFGVSTQALMYPNQNLDKNLLKNVFFPSFFIIAREYYTRREIMDADTCTTNKTAANLYSRDLCPDETGADVTLAIYVFYLIFLNLLMVNMLIVIFNNNYKTLERVSGNLWRYQRYLLVYEYFFKPILPPPFQVFSFCIIFFKVITRELFNSRILTVTGSVSNFFYDFSKKTNLGFINKIENEHVENSIVRWETFAIDELRSIRFRNRNKSDLENENINQRFNSLNESVKEINKKFDRYFNDPYRFNLMNAYSSIKRPITPGTPMKLFDKVETFQNTTAKASKLQVLELNMVKIEPESVKKETENKVNKPKKSLSPRVFTSREVLLDANSDPDLLSIPVHLRPTLKFNAYDFSYEVDRKSHAGDYEVHDGIPINPLYDYGLFGRGNLKHWGPNHAYQFIFIRNVLDDVSDVEKKLEIIAMEDLDVADHEPSLTLPHLFFTNELSFELTRRIIDQFMDDKQFYGNYSIYEKLKECVENKKSIANYVPVSKLNTNNAWVEFELVLIDLAKFKHLITKDFKSSAWAIGWVELNTFLNQSTNDPTLAKFLNDIFK